MSDWFFITRNVESINRHIDKGLCYVDIEGDLIKDSNSLFLEMSEKLKFPEYFGKNWNALQDCLRDLEWIPSDYGYIIIWSNASIMMMTSPDEFFEFMNILQYVNEYWSGIGKIFKLIVFDEKFCTIYELFKDGKIIT
jgi:RNAse (barnase) inhibitor barstar